MRKVVSNLNETELSKVQIYTIDTIYLVPPYRDARISNTFFIKKSVVENWFINK